MPAVGMGWVEPFQSVPTTTQVFAFGHDAANASSLVTDVVVSCHVAPPSVLVSSWPVPGTNPVVAVEVVPAARQVVPAQVTPRSRPTPAGRVAAPQVAPWSAVVAIAPLPWPG